MSFLFQAIPERYDLSQRLHTGETANWIASRHRDRMAAGEVIYFWQGGDPQLRGLYGWGVIVGQKPFLDEAGIYRIEVEYRRNFLDYDPPSHIPSQTVHLDPILQNHLIFRMPIGTNFLLDEAEDGALRAIIRSTFGEDWLPPVQPKPEEAD